ncbi:MAG: alpha/beta hydrolase [Acidimicrobiaceae bacterium]|jgi:pimeloyl-ACP methyl ester carboxylesterase|nr:alpha/beta hydrolase [Acidimicrobiaceae bacterium]HJL91863.1 alpha/beta hydrolase [Acidimicrobiales bacterium]|tara:strand:- start:1207 stop:2076 length:870 start_codon:yes stop_codon:yes gene_type:complete
MPTHELLETVELSDGRSLSFASFGDPAGRPVFYFHGFPGSRFEPQSNHEAYLKAGIRLLALDRPGIGYSTRKNKRQLLDWPDDVVEVAKILNLEKFSVLGVSGGGPYALACARAIPGYLDKVTVACGLGPMDAPNATSGMMLSNRILFSYGRFFPPLLRLSVSLMVRQLSSKPVKGFEKFVEGLPEPDRLVLSGANAQELVLASAVEGVRQGSKPLLEEISIYSKFWGFELSDLNVPVSLFQGEADIDVPASMARYQAELIPNCELNLYPTDGHFSLLVNRIDEITASL